jgi:hypothetical protein
MILDCDAPKYEGHGRLLPQQTHFIIVENTEAKSQNMLSPICPLAPLLSYARPQKINNHKQTPNKNRIAKIQDYLQHDQLIST